jgi:hypothetical protein
MATIMTTSKFIHKGGTAHRTSLKKLVTCLALAGIFTTLTALAIAIWHNGLRPPAAGGVKYQSPPAPEKMIAMGPVGTDITSSEIVGRATVRMTASRLWVKKSKLFGFDNALFKKLAARDFCLTVSKAGRKILSVRKDQMEMPMDRRVIVIHDPEILFPNDLGHPDRITLDKPNKVLVFHRGASEKTWNLAGN